jgi:transcriptional regulator NrdR family protein
MLVGAVIIVQLNYAQVTVVLMAYAKTTHVAYVRMASVAKDAK